MLLMKMIIMCYMKFETSEVLRSPHDVNLREKEPITTRANK